MAHVSLAPEDIKALEQTRQRLYQLTSNIASLKTDIVQSNPLPQWSVASLFYNIYLFASGLLLFQGELANNTILTGPPSRPLPRS